MKMRSLWALLAGLALAPLAAGCGHAAESCDLVCDCTGCSEREYDECIAEYEGAEETAAAYDCSAEFDEFTLCALEEYRCTAGFFGPDPGDLLACAGEADDLNDCQRNGSRLD